MVGTQKLPTPPIPVMPSEGLAPVTENVDTTGQDAASPTTMVLNYLKSRGFTPSSENVRRALEANSRDPGVISGLRSDTAATEAEDQAAMGVRGQSRSAGRPTPSIPPTQPPPVANATTVPPVAESSDGSGSDKLIATLGLLAPSVASAILGRRALPTPGEAAGPMPDVGAAPVESKVVQGFRQPVDEALSKATEGAPVVEGVKPVDPDLLGNRRPGPSARVEGDKVPQMPNAEARAAARARPTTRVRPPPIRVR